MKNIVSIVDNDVMLEKAGESLNLQPTITRFCPFLSGCIQAKNMFVIKTLDQDQDRIEVE